MCQAWTRDEGFCAAWCDEVAKWPKCEETWDNLMLSLRLGRRPRTVVTTTPRPTAVALWSCYLIEASRGPARGGRSGTVRVVIGVDPPAGIGRDACGIVACALDAAVIGHVLDDASIHGRRRSAAVAGAEARIVSAAR